MELLLLTSFAASKYTYTLTPCAANSFRVRVGLSNLPSATSALQRALNDRLRSEGLNDLPGAFVCPPMSPGTVKLSSRAATTSNGNLRVDLSADAGSISFSRVDTGSKYFEL